MNEPWNSLRRHLRQRFGNQRIAKIPLDAGLSCPNKDGRFGTGGCIFCDAYGAGPVAAGHLTVGEQIDRFTRHRPGCRFIAYFQAHANTYAPLSRLRQLFEPAVNRPEVVGLALATRPDAIEEEVFPYLEELGKRTWLTVELGLQSIHEKSLVFLERHHSLAQFLDTFLRLKKLHIEVVVHLIVGIPGETFDDWLATVKEMNRIGPAGVKFHLLHVLKGTRLHDLYRSGRLPLLGQEEYVESIIRLLERLRPDIVVHRLAVDREGDLFVAPDWARRKAAVIQAIRAGMRSGNTYQGRLGGEYPDQPSRLR